MSNQAKAIRAMIENNKTSDALRQLSGLATDETMKNQLSILAARFRETRNREIINAIPGTEASVIYAQVNHSVLTLLAEYEQSQPAAGGAVFLSYNHADQAIAHQLKQRLVENNVEVFIDSEKMMAGEDIREFIENCIANTRTTISIVSKKSLLSAWVAMESVNTFYHEKTNAAKKFIACYIEDDFFRRNYADDALDLIDAEIADLEALIRKRVEKGRNIRDITDENTRLKDLRNNFDAIIQRLRSGLCIDIRGPRLEENLPLLIRSIGS